MSSSQPMDGPHLSRGTKWALLVGASLLICVVLLLAAEAAVRIRAHIKYGSTATADELYTVDAATGLRVPIAGLDTGRIKVNSRGFRGPEIDAPKPPGTVRLAFLGASTTWCAEVTSNEHAWPHLVTEALRARWPDRRFDYVNGGVPGYTIASSLSNLQKRVAQLDPDVIVIYHATNDLSGELREVAVEQGLLAEARFEAMSWPAEYSLLWKLAEMNLRIMAAQQAAAANSGRLVLDPDRLGTGFRERLTELVRAAQAEAPVVAIATFATQLRHGQVADQQRVASQSAMFWMPFMSPQGLVAAYERYNDVIREVARDTGALLIDDLDLIPGSPEYFTDTVHFTDAGSLAMADRVTPALEAALPQVLARPSGDATE